MFKSNPIPMIQNGNQISAIKLIACYQYKNSGEHKNQSSPPMFLMAASSGGSTSYFPLNVYIYGINKTGDTNLIATCPLETTSAYTAGEYASTTVVGIPTYDYNFICYTYDPYSATDFDRILSLSLIADTREMPDVVDSNTYTKVYIS